MVKDGDYNYDDLHDEFYKIVFDLHKENYSFSEIVSLLSESNCSLPFVWYSALAEKSSWYENNRVQIDNNNFASVLPESLISYEMGKALSDKTHMGKWRIAILSQYFLLQT